MLVGFFFFFLPSLSFCGREEITLKALFGSYVPKHMQHRLNAECPNLLTVISLKFFHSAFDHSNSNSAFVNLYPSKSVKKVSGVLSLYPLCLFLYWILSCCWEKKNKQPLYFLNICCLHPLWPFCQTKNSEL